MRKNLNIFAPSSNLIKSCFKPIIASSLALALSASAVIASPNTGTGDSANNIMSIFWKEQGGFWVPTLENNTGTALNNLWIAFKRGAGEGSYNPNGNIASGGSAGNISANNDDWIFRFDTRGRPITGSTGKLTLKEATVSFILSTNDGKGIQMGENGTGTLIFDFAGSQNAVNIKDKKFTLDLSTATGQDNVVFKGNIFVPSYAKTGQNSDSGTPTNNTVTIKLGDSAQQRTIQGRLTGYGSTVNIEGGILEGVNVTVVGGGDSGGNNTGGATHKVAIGFDGGGTDRRKDVFTVNLKNGAKVKGDIASYRSYRIASDAIDAIRRKVTFEGASQNSDMVLEGNIASFSTGDALSINTQSGNEITFKRGSMRGNIIANGGNGASNTYGGYNKVTFGENGASELQTINSDDTQKIDGFIYTRAGTNDITFNNHGEITGEVRTYTRFYFIHATNTITVKEGKNLTLNTGINSKNGNNGTESGKGNIIIFNGGNGSTKATLKIGGSPQTNKSDIGITTSDNGYNGIQVLNSSSVTVSKITGNSGTSTIGFKKGTNTLSIDSINTSGTTTNLWIDTSLNGTLVSTGVADGNTTLTVEIKNGVQNNGGTLYIGEKNGSSIKTDLNGTAKPVETITINSGLSTTGGSGNNGKKSHLVAKTITINANSSGTSKDALYSAGIGNGNGNGQGNTLIANNLTITGNIKAGYSSNGGIGNGNGFNTLNFDSATITGSILGVGGKNTIQGNGTTVTGTGVQTASNEENTTLTIKGETSDKIEMRGNSAGINTLKAGTITIGGSDGGSYGDIVVTGNGNSSDNANNKNIITATKTSNDNGEQSSINARSIQTYGAAKNGSTSRNGNDKGNHNIITFYGSGSITTTNGIIAGRVNGNNSNDNTGEDSADNKNTITFKGGGSITSNLYAYKGSNEITFEKTGGSITGDIKTTGGKTVLTVGASSGNSAYTLDIKGQLETVNKLILGSNGNNDGDTLFKLADTGGTATLKVKEGQAKTIEIKDDKYTLELGNNGTFTAENLVGSSNSGTNAIAGTLKLNDGSTLILQGKYDLNNNAGMSDSHTSSTHTDSSKIKTLKIGNQTTIDLSKGERTTSNTPNNHPTASTTTQNFRLLEIGSNDKYYNAKNPSGLQGNGSTFILGINPNANQDSATLGGKKANDTNNMNTYGYAYSDRIIIHDAAPNTTANLKLIFSKGISAQDLQKITYTPYTGTETRGNIALVTVKSNNNQALVDFGAEAEGELTSIVGFSTITTVLAKTPTDENGKVDNSTSSEYTTYFADRIKEVKLSEVDQTLLPSVFANNYDLWIANFNSLNKRMGELRENTFSQGAWSRVFGGKMSNELGLSTTSDYVTLQAGYDYALGFEGGNNFLGFALSYALSNSKTNQNSLSDFKGVVKTIFESINSSAIEFALYNSYVTDGINLSHLNTSNWSSGFYNDTIAKISYILSDFNLSRIQNNQTISQSYKTTNLGFTLSNETGYQFKLGENNQWSIIPQIELTLGYLNQSNFKQILEQQEMSANAEGVLNLRTRIGSHFSYDFKDFFDKESKIKLQAYWGAHYEYDTLSGGKITILLNQGFNANPLQSKLKDNGRFAINIGTHLSIHDNTKIYFDFEKNLGGKINTNYQFSLGARYNFGENTSYQPNPTREQKLPTTLTPQEE